MDQEVEKIKMSEEFRICPACGYRDGFHSMFRKQGRTTQWLFICPSCHKIFDIGFTLPLGSKHTHEIDDQGKE
ncbi:hypothetical protein DSCW_25770 [Desulfosarcina widdelii]|uniref:Uncharacterized protein n=1 Tax=Desulfosarcina widdelii TaxID=947919 RepID=A0A5K7Z3B7_9BACT|nr:hypothetical protein DSCW_25770 [Desulfosarcina widdelii]